MRRAPRVSSAGLLLLLLIAAPLLVAGCKPGGDRIERVEVRIGPEQTVFRWAEDACEANDVPDLAVRAFRDEGDLVQMLNPHFVTYRFVGPGLNRLRHQCIRVASSDRNPDPAAFDDAEWVTSPYTLDGRTIYALIHNEYHGHEHKGRCPSGEYNKCWYNAITLAISRDGGRSYSDARPPPRHLVASLPYRYVPDAGPIGIFEPSNIVRKPDDGRYYFLARTEQYRAQQRGTCLFRTSNLADPASWRAWDGEGFGVRPVNPYSIAPAQPKEHVCHPVSPDEIGAMSQSLTYNTYLEKYLLVGSSMTTTRRGRHIAGVFFSTSEDLIHWSMRQLMMPAELAQTFRCGDLLPIAYPSLLDPGSASRNFETTGQHAYLYFTRLNYQDCRLTLDRDLIRIPVEFSR